MEPYVILGSYIPTVLRGRVIGEALTAITKKQGFIPLHDPTHGPIEKAIWCDPSLHAEVRRYTNPNITSAEDWHYDGDTTPGAKSDYWLITWANVMPTQLRLKSNPSKIHQAKPFELIAFHNKLMEHRRPKGCPHKRWMFRQRALWS